MSHEDFGVASFMKEVTKHLGKGTAFLTISECNPWGTLHQLPFTSVQDLPRNLICRQYLTFVWLCFLVSRTEGSNQLESWRNSQLIQERN